LKGLGNLKTGKADSPILQCANVLKFARHFFRIYPQLTLYHLLNILFHLDSQGYDWVMTDEMHGLFKFFELIEMFFAQNRLPQYFNPAINLLETIDPHQVSTIRNRIKGLQNSKVKFIKVLTSA